MYLKAYIQNLVKNGPVVSEKKHVLIFICKWLKIDLEKPKLQNLTLP